MFKTECIREIPESGRQSLIINGKAVTMRGDSYQTYLPNRLLIIVLSKVDACYRQLNEGGRSENTVLLDYCTL